MGNCIIFLELDNNKMKLLPVRVEDKYFGIDISGLRSSGKYDCRSEASGVIKQDNGAKIEPALNEKYVSGACGYAGQF